MRTTLSLDPVILTAAKQVAAETHQSVGAVISEWAARGLKSGDAPKTGRRKGAAKSLFPTFDIPEESPPITSQHVKALLAEEGL